METLNVDRADVMSLVIVSTASFKTLVQLSIKVENVLVFTIK